MIKTTAMRLIELMVYKEDIRNVLKYLGEMGEFQFQEDFSGASSSDSSSEGSSLNPDREIFARLETVRASLAIDDLTSYTETVNLPTDADFSEAQRFISTVDELHQRELAATDELKKISDAYNEAMAFSNLKVPYSQLESLSFLTLRIGKIDSSKFDVLKMSLGSRGIVAALGEDKSRVMIACSKKARFFVDAQLEKVGFVALEVPKDFKGVPEDAMQKLLAEKDEQEQAVAAVQEERKNFAAAHKEKLLHLLQIYSVSAQITDVENKLESTQFVYRISGWLPSYRVADLIRDLDTMTEKRTGIRNFLPEEVPSVASGQEKVPVELKHGKIVSNFERMIFSYGSPLYGTIDPTPFVALFFTILFGIMFGDAGQGLVFLIVGVLMCKKKIKLMGWEKFGTIFVSIGITSTFMGLLTGEFFGTETVLEPFSHFVTGLFGEPRGQILPMMPTGSAESIKRMFLFFGFTVAVGFLINTCGLIINMINNFHLKRYGRFFFGKNGLSGALFFWYVVFFAIRVAFLHQSPAWFDWTVIGVTLLITAFCEPLERVIDGKKPVFENGLFSAVIGALVELIEVLSGYISNTVSFVRVGAFALAHAVLGFIISLLSGAHPDILTVNPVVAIIAFILGNAIVVVLEGMIVAIQVVRLQYYEFFSKFFTETGREFSPFAFHYVGVN